MAPVAHAGRVDARTVLLADDDENFRAALAEWANIRANPALWRRLAEKKLAPTSNVNFQVGEHIRAFCDPSGSLFNLRLEIPLSVVETRAGEADASVRRLGPVSARARPGKRRVQSSATLKD